MSLLKKPGGRIMSQRLGVLLHVADEYNYICLSIRCQYYSETIRVNTALGDHYSKPWYKRILR